MTETARCVHSVLPRELARITLEYFLSAKRTVYYIAKAGEYETCFL